MNYHNVLSMVSLSEEADKFQSFEKDMIIKKSGRSEKPKAEKSNNVCKESIRKNEGLKYVVC